MKVPHDLTGGIGVEPPQKAQRSSANGPGQFGTRYENSALPFDRDPEVSLLRRRPERADKDCWQKINAFILETDEIRRVAPCDRGIERQVHASWIGYSSLMARVSRHTSGVYCRRTRSRKDSRSRRSSSARMSPCTHAARVAPSRRASILR